MAAIDPLTTIASGISGPLRKLFAVTPHDTNEISFVSRALYVGVTGNVKITDAEGNDITMVGLAAGVWHPVRALRVFSTGTTATSILGGY